LNRIELGGGETPEIRPNVDVRPGPSVDIVADFDKGLPMLESGKYDDVLCRYALEHVSWRNVPTFLKEVYRIMASGGKITFVVPNLLEQCRLVASQVTWSTNSPIMIFGDQNYGENAHKCGWSPAQIKADLETSGFTDINIQPVTGCITDMVVTARKGSVPDVFEREYFEDGNTGYLMYRDFVNHWNVVEDVLKLKPANVLDVGGSRGFIAHKLSAAGVPTSVLEVSKYCYYTRVTDHFIQWDATQVPWPLKDKEVDLCISMSFLEHIPEDKIDTVIREMIRVSKRGWHGVTFTQAPNDIDKTHKTLRSQEWWLERFSNIDKEYSVFIVPDSMVNTRPITTLPQGEGMVKLNLGSYTTMFWYGWVNIDTINLKEFAEQNGFLFQLHDLNNKLPYKDGSVDLIFASHVLEHLGTDPLADWFRVLRPGGRIRIIVPDMEKLNKMYTDGSISNARYFNADIKDDMSPGEILNHLLYHNHVKAFDAMSLTKNLKAVGFENIAQKKPFVSTDRRMMEQTYDVFPEISLIVEAQKPNPEAVVKTLEYSQGTLGNREGPLTMKPVDAVRIETPKPSLRQHLDIGLISTPFLDTPPKSYGGLELVVANLGTELAKRGHKVTIYATDDSKVPGCEIVKCGPCLNTTQVDWHAAERAMYEVYKDVAWKHNIVHGHNWFGFEYLLKTKHPELKVLHTHHGGINPEWWMITRPTFKLNMIGISDWMRQTYDSMGMPSKFVYNGVDLSAYPFNPGPRNKYMMFVGRIDTFKQPHTAIKIAKEMNIPIVVVGGSFVHDTRYLDEVKKACDVVLQGPQDKKDIDIKGATLWLDAPHDAKVALLQNCQNLIFTSCMGEPFGLVVIESMSTGTPVVAVNDGAIPELVKQGGIVVPVYQRKIDPGGRLNYATSMMFEQMVKDAIGKVTQIKPEDARKNAEMFTMSRMADAYEVLYNEVLEGREW
jgi:glycosyltransferase involved in cell wall biosynthesis/predicted SAM-dependent methyltransferase